MRPTIELRPDRKAVLILCRFRHVIDSVPLDEWAGSREESRSSNARRCPACEQRP